MFYLGLGCGFVIGAFITFLTTLRIFCSPSIERADKLEVEVSRLRGERDRANERNAYIVSALKTKVDGLPAYDEKVEKAGGRRFGVA